MTNPSPWRSGSRGWRGGAPSLETARGRGLGQHHGDLHRQDRDADREPDDRPRCRHVARDGNRDWSGRPPGPGNTGGCRRSGSGSCGGAAGRRCAGVGCFAQAGRGRVGARRRPDRDRLGRGGRQGGPGRRALEGGPAAPGRHPLRQRCGLDGDAPRRSRLAARRVREGSGRAGPAALLPRGGRAGRRLRQPAVGRPPPRRSHATACACSRWHNAACLQKAASTTTTCAIYSCWGWSRWPIRRVLPLRQLWPPAPVPASTSR